MTWKNRYDVAKQNLLDDKRICKENRELFRRFFEFEEYKLKRQNRLPGLDNGCCRTLLTYVSRLRNVNSWFGNKPWRNLTKADIKRVYDDLEEGRITNRKGEHHRDTASYYNKILKSKPFRMIGKADLAKEVLEFGAGNRDREVRFVTEAEFRKLVSVVSNPNHLLLFWLQWDIGENINTLLQLTKQDVIRQKNPDTHEIEYLINLPREKLKRSRRTRSEPTLYPETVRFLDIALKDLKDDEPLFGFGHRQALKLMAAAVRRSGARCMPHKDAITWKDLRSGMACHLLKNGWSRDEVNARLGHTPSSKTLDAYINYLAIDRHRPKQKLHKTSLEEVQNQLEESRRQAKLQGERIRRQDEQIETLNRKVDRVLGAWKRSEGNVGA